MSRLLLPRFVCLAAIVVAGSTARADVQSGPLAGPPPSPLKVFVAAGDPSGKEIDLVATRASQPTIIAFVPQEKWSRPVARFLKSIDTGLKDVDGGRLCAVWLSPDHAATRDYLPKAQAAVMFERTDLTDFTGDVGGPPEWGINGEADVTVVALRDGKVVQTWGFVSVNETVAKEVLKAVSATPK